MGGKWGHFIEGQACGQGDDEGKLGCVHCELLEGHSRTHKCPRGWTRLDLRREFCVGWIALGLQLHVVFELGENEIASSMKSTQA